MAGEFEVFGRLQGGLFRGHLLGHRVDAGLGLVGFSLGRGGGLGGLLDDHVERGRVGRQGADRLSGFRIPYDHVARPVARDDAFAVVREGGLQREVLHGGE